MQKQCGIEQTERALDEEANDMTDYGHEREHIAHLISERKNNTTNGRVDKQKNIRAEAE
jgi:hypothetical protein